MLYQLHEMQRAFLTPLAAATQWATQLYANPFSPWAYTPLAREFAAGYELAHRLGKDYVKPEWGIDHTQVEGKTVAITQKEIEVRPFCKLVRFERDLPRDRAPRVLLVAPLSGHHATLLRDTVRSLIQAHDVYVTDWVDARVVPLSEGSFHLDDYVQYIQAFINRLGPDVHVISVCQPTVPVLAAISLLAAQGAPSAPRTMTMMGGPIDPRQAPTEVNKLAATKPYSWFETQLIHTVPGNYPGAGRRVYPGFLQHAGFVAMNPDRHLNSHYDFYRHLLRGDDADAEAHRKFYDEYNAVMDMPGEYYLDTIKIVFQEHQLPLGRWKVKGERVTPGAITKTALFTVEGELDDISGQGQTRAAHDLCTGIPTQRKQHLTVEGCGHYGIFAGRRWREIIYPQIAAFIEANQP